MAIPHDHPLTPLILKNALHHLYNTRYQGINQAYYPQFQWDIDHTIYAEMRATIHYAIRHLTPLERALIHVYYIRRYTYSQLVERYGEKTASHLSRHKANMALIKLCQIINTQHCTTCINACSEQ